MSLSQYASFSCPFSCHFFHNYFVKTCIVSAESKGGTSPTIYIINHCESKSLLLQAQIKNPCQPTSDAC